MLKKRIVGLVAGIALIVAVAATSVGITNSLVALTTPQAVACNVGGSSGGGC